MNLEFYKKQLADLKRSNKARKLKLAERYGYETVEGYKAGLEYDISGFTTIDISKSTVEEKPTIHTIYVLDRSGSMSSKIINAIDGIKADAEALTDSTNNVYSIVGFSYSDRVGIELNRGNSIKHLATITTGFTALYDGIMKAISLITPGEKTILKIFTDGGENDSITSESQIKLNINKCMSEGVTITFVGTPADTKSIVNKLGIDKSNTLTHDNTAKGVKEAFNTTKKATKAYVKKVINKEDTLTGFYKTTETL